MGKITTGLRQTNKQPISSKQIVALFIHTNQQYIEFSETTKWRDWIWIKTPRVTRNVLGQSWLQSPFSRSCVLHSQKSSEFLPIIQCVLSPKKNLTSSSFPFLTYIYHPSRPKFVSKKENSPISFLLLFFFFFKSSNQKQSSQFQIPLQNLPRRVPPSLNSNSKFPCKSMKFLKLNNCMNR